MKLSFPYLNYQKKQKQKQTRDEILQFTLKYPVPLTRKTYIFMVHF